MNNPNVPITVTVEIGRVKVRRTIEVDLAHLHVFDHKAFNKELPEMVTECVSKYFQRGDVLITNYQGQLDVSEWPSDPVAKMAIESYSFLIPFGATVTARELANLIAKYYDANEPHNKAAIEALLSL